MTSPGLIEHAVAIDAEVTQLEDALQGGEVIPAEMVSICMYRKEFRLKAAGGIKPQNGASYLYEMNLNWLCPVWMGQPPPSQTCVSPLP